MLEILSTMQQWRDENRQIALATVIKTWGSAPRRAGSKMGITSQMAMTGSVSGGCVEGATVETAIEVLKSGTSQVIKFGVADETAWDVGLTCGGSIELFVEALDETWWSHLADQAQSDKRAVSITFLDGSRAGQKALFDAKYDVLYATTDITEDLVTLAKNARKTGIQTLNDARVMVDVIAARPHLILIGGVHVAIPLQKMARDIGFRVSIIDPRSAFATEERFPEVATILHSYPDKALPEIGMDADTYLAVLTHDPKIDDKALTTALPANLPYVGVLSSRKTHEKRVARLREAGISDEQIAMIKAPVGMDIGARTPEEIAVSILAEIVAVRNGVL
ncbi:MAG: XdhC family protein [Aggregatilineales bacterium]